MTVDRRTPRQLAAYDQYFNNARNQVAAGKLVSDLMKEMHDIPPDDIASDKKRGMSEGAHAGQLILWKSESSN